MDFKPYKNYMEIDTMDAEFIMDLLKKPLEKISLQDINECLSDYIRYIDNPNQLEFNWRQGTRQWDVRVVILN